MRKRLKHIDRRTLELVDQRHGDMMDTLIMTKFGLIGGFEEPGQNNGTESRDLTQGCDVRFIIKIGFLGNERNKAIGTAFEEHGGNDQGVKLRPKRDVVDRIFGAELAMLEDMGFVARHEFYRKIAFDLHERASHVRKTANGGGDMKRKAL